MNHNFSKHFLAATASLVAFTSLSFADTDNAQMRNLENRVSALEQKRGSTGMINPPARPQIKNGADLFLTGDLLYWQAHEDGLPVYIMNEGINTDLSDAEAKEFDWDWNFGCRVGLGYNTCHDGWDLSATWLHFNTDADRKKNVDSDDALWPTLTHPDDHVPNTLQELGTGPFKRANAHWSMNLNQIDLDLGREYYVSKWLTVRPHLGLRTAWIHQKLNAHYNRFLVNGTYTSGMDDYIEMKTDFWGLGLEAGIDTQWGLGGGWSIFGNAGFGMLYGFHEPDREDEARNGVEFDFVDMDWSYRTTRAIADLELGLRFDSWTNDERLHFRIQAGWEHHIYFSQNQFVHFVDDVAIGNFIGNQGDLTLQGWTLSARLDF